jgi:hypothetical protein
MSVCVPESRDTSDSINSLIAAKISAASYVYNLSTVKFAITAITSAITAITSAITAITSAITAITSAITAITLLSLTDRIITETLTQYTFLRK